MKVPYKEFQELAEALGDLSAITFCSSAKY